MTDVSGFAGTWRRLCDGLEWISRIIIGGAIVAIVAITVIAVWYRYVINDPLSWTEQICRILFVWSVFAGAAVLYRQMLHIVIDMFIQMMPAAWQTAFFWLNQMLMLFCGLMMLYFGTVLTLGTWDQTFGALEISPASFYSAAPFCGLLIVIFWVEKVLDPQKRVPSGEVHL